ncbi:hypothetical protein [Rubripirellula lacrimiformis]|nr:hypothetical protein [Rubripirellula lacrimiformis]
MQTFDILPAVGVGPIRFGMTRADVRKLIGPHELNAASAVAHVEKMAPFDPDAPEPGYTYVFPTLQLSLWRSVIPDASQDADDPTGRTFEAVGVGPDGYFTTTSWVATV